MLLYELTVNKAVPKKWFFIWIKFKTRIYNFLFRSLNHLTYLLAVFFFNAVKHVLLLGILKKDTESFTVCYGFISSRIYNVFFLRIYKKDTHIKEILLSWLINISTREILLIEIQFPISCVPYFVMFLISSTSDTPSLEFIFFWFNTV